MHDPVHVLLVGLNHMHGPMQNFLVCFGAPKLYAFPICKCYAFLNILLGYPLCLTTTHKNILLKQVPIQKLSSPHCDEMEGREIRRSRRPLKSGQGPPGRVLAVRQFSPLRRKEGLHPLPPTCPPRQKPPRFTVSCALPNFTHFSDLVAIPPRWR